MADIEEKLRQALPVWEAPPCENACMATDGETGDLAVACDCKDTAMRDKMLQWSERMNLAKRIMAAEEAIDSGRLVAMTEQEREIATLRQAVDKLKREKAALVEENSKMVEGISGIKYLVDQANVKRQAG